MHAHTYATRCLYTFLYMWVCTGKWCAFAVHLTAFILYRYNIDDFAYAWLCTRFFLSSTYIHAYRYTILLTIQCLVMYVCSEYLSIYLFLVSFGILWHGCTLSNTTCTYTCIHIHIYTYTYMLSGCGYALCSGCFHMHFYYILLSPFSLLNL